MIGQPERSCFDQDFNEKTETSIVLKLKKWIEHKRSQRLQSQMELRESDVTDLKVFSESIIAYKIITRRSDLLTEQENLTIEELIQLKLEISTKHVLFHKLYGFPLLGMIKEIAKDAIKNFARDNIASKREANEILGRF